MEKIFFISLGCDKNLVDSEVMLGLIEKNGYAVTYDEHEADAVVVNTCGFIADAVKESIENILGIGSLKEDGKLKALIVTGCLVERYKDEIFKEMPEVDAVVGTGDYEKIASVLNDVLDGKKRISAISDRNNNPAEASVENRVLTGPGHYAYLKIAEGCVNRCTYCTIWQIRGEYRSRRIESLVRETENLAGKGVKELILAAQDTALYGIDLYGESCLDKLISELSKISGIEWIRILYAYPEHITDALIEEMAKNPKCCHYIDMPIQHADDKILNLMGRRSSHYNLKLLIKKLRSAIPDIAIRTTLITGFPGEGDDEFENLLNFVTDIGFDRLGVFEYSREDGTLAANMPEQVSAKTKRKRKEIIMKTQKEISAAKLKNKTGQKLKVIVDGKIEDAYCGRSFMDCYGIDGMVFFDAEYEILSGEFVEVEVTGSSEYDLYGKLNDSLTNL